METRHQVDAALIAHYRGDTRPVEARERSEDKLPPVVVLCHDPDGARSALRAAKAKRGRGRPGTVEMVDCLFGGPPPYDSPGAWKTERVHDWAEQTLDWFRARAPRAFIVGAYLHQDERSPI